MVANAIFNICRQVVFCFLKWSLLWDDAVTRNACLCNGGGGGGRGTGFSNHIKRRGEGTNNASKVADGRQTGSRLRLNDRKPVYRLRCSCNKCWLITSATYSYTNAFVLWWFEKTRNKEFMFLFLWSPTRVSRAAYRNTDTLSFLRSFRIIRLRSFFVSNRLD